MFLHVCVYSTHRYEPTPMDVVGRVVPMAQNGREMAIVYAQNQVYPILAAYHYHGQECVCKFYLKCDTVGSASENPQAVMEHWVETQLDIVQELVNTEVNFFYLRTWRMFMEEQGTFERSIDVDGLRTLIGTAPFPAFVTAGYRLITTNGVSNSGWLRFSGLTTADIDYDPSAQGEVYKAEVGSSLPAAITAFQEMMIGTYTSDAGNVFSYVVMSKYLGALNPLNIASVNYPKLGTQNSRKVGVGQ